MHVVGCLHCFIFSILSLLPYSASIRKYYKLTCNNEYVRQSGRDIQIRYKEHINQIRNCNPQSAYENHILQNRHEFGPAETTLRLLKQCNKGGRMNCWEFKYIQEFQRVGRLITEQQTYDFNPFLAITPKKKRSGREN